MLRFTGGISPEYSKLTEKKEIMVAKLPKKVVIPLSQHIGAVCKPIVSINEYITIGQKIADSNEYCSAPIHSSISGVVKEIREMPHPCGKSINSIVIESSGKIEWHKSVRPRDEKDIEKLAREELLKIIREAGIVGLGGAAFPTHVKLNVKEKKIDTIILNGAECEPYLTCDHRLMLEQPEKIIKGLLLIIKIAGAEKGIIGIEGNKEDAIDSIAKKAEEFKNIEVAKLYTQYPQGAEKMLAYSITKRKVPPRCLPLDVNVVVSNVGTAKAIYDAVYEGKPLIERVVTVTGAVKEPKNLLVKIGTSFEDAIHECGGCIGQANRIVMGGPLMGIAQQTVSVPVIKGTTGILALEGVHEKRNVCIRCSRCVDVCPVFLMPTAIARYAEKELYELADSYNALDCFECGCCAYVCPSKIPLVELIKKAKCEISKNNIKK